MKSKISFCNLTVIKKDILRFWPFWVVELILLQIMNNIILCSGLADIFREEYVTAQEKLREAQQLTADCLSVGLNVFVIAVAAIIGAILVFGYLGRKVSAYAIHSLPLSRTTLFCSHYLAGFLMITVPFVLTFLVTGVVSLAYGLGMDAVIFGVFLELLIVILFFYSLASLVMMVSGSGEMSALIYGVINFLAAGFTGLLGTVMETSCYGMAENTMLDMMRGSLVEYLTPIFHFLKVVRGSVDTGFDRGYSYLSVWKMPVSQSSAGVWNVFPWGGLGQCAWYILPAVLFCAAAWYLYQKRPLENTGDTMAFSWCKVVFRIIFSVCGSMIFAIVFWAATSELWGPALNYQFSFYLGIVLLAVGSAVSYLIGDMILAKSFMIWKKISFWWLGAVCIAMPLVFIISNQVYQKNSVIDEQDVKELHIEFGGVSYQYNDGTCPEGLRELQKEILEGGRKESFYEDWEFSERFYLEYVTKAEKKESRVYSITYSKQPELLIKIQKFFNSQEDKIERMFPEKYDAQHMSGLSLWWGDESLEDEREWTVEEYTKIYDAVIADLKAGNIIVADIEAAMAEESGEQNVLVLWFGPEDTRPWDYGYLEQRLFISDKCTNVLQALKELEIEF